MQKILLLTYFISLTRMTTRKWRKIRFQHILSRFSKCVYIHKSQYETSFLHSLARSPLNASSACSFASLKELIAAVAVAAPSSERRTGMNAEAVILVLDIYDTSNSVCPFAPSSLVIAWQALVPIVMHIIKGNGQNSSNLLNHASFSINGMETGCSGMIISNIFDCSLH